jgi:predicted outer membrane repeat protein
VTDSKFAGNSTSGQGGGVYLDNNGSVAMSDSVIRDNSAAYGGGIENAAMRVTFERLTVTGNKAALDGGGIESNGSGTFTIVDTDVSKNTAENGGGLSNGADGALRVVRSTFWDNRALQRFEDDTGLGGGIYGLGDAEAEYENVTIAGNYAQVRGGGLYIDSDASVRVANTTIAHNAAPAASGVGGEITSINFPVVPSTSVIFRDTIVAGNEVGPNCTFAIGSQGGNLDDGDTCFFRGLRDRVNAPDPGLDAIADNGGPTMTMALHEDGFAVDGGVGPCPSTDQRGVSRPQNVACDIGAFEFEGPFGPPDTTPPDTEYLAGPVQDTENTSIFRFGGSDDKTPASELLFEWRLLETEIGEPPEPPDPTEPPPPEELFVGCPNPWQVPLVEDGLFTFEVRAIDRAGNVDPTPAVHEFGGMDDATPPETFFEEKPPNPSTRN